ncbi:hypothetical protein U1Q18_000743 [Sarracenia purpurea var. burkii]
MIGNHRGREQRSVKVFGVFFKETEVSGLSGSTETAQSQVSVGIGLLAGSTVMLLTVIWGTCVIVGKCDLEDSFAIDGKDTKGCSLTSMSLGFLNHHLFPMNKNLILVKA